ANMLRFARFMAATFGSRLLELIHTPLGFGIKNGQKVPLSFWGGDVNADHFDHVHVAMRDGGFVKRGGWALVGEQGPELARLPSGTTVFPHGMGPEGEPMTEQTARRLAAALERLESHEVSELALSRAALRVLGKAARPRSARPLYGGVA